MDDYVDLRSASYVPALRVASGANLAPVLEALPASQLPAYQVVVGSTEMTSACDRGGSLLLRFVVPLALVVAALGCAWWEWWLVLWVPLALLPLWAGLVAADYHFSPLGVEHKRVVLEYDLRRRALRAESELRRRAFDAVLSVYEGRHYG